MLAVGAGDHRLAQLLCALVDLDFQHLPVLGQLGLDALAVGDVAADAKHLCGPGQRAAMPLCLDPAFAGLPMPPARLEARRRRSAGRQQCQRPGLRMVEVPIPQALRGGLGRAGAQQLGKAWIGLQHPTLGVEQVHGVLRLLVQEGLPDRGQVSHSGRPMPERGRPGCRPGQRHAGRCAGVAACAGQGWCWCRTRRPATAGAPGPAAVPAPGAC